MVREKLTVTDDTQETSDIVPETVTCAEKEPQCTRGTKKLMKNLIIGIHEENGVISLVTEQGTISSYQYTFHEHK